MILWDPWYRRLPIHSFAWTVGALHLQRVVCLGLKKVSGAHFLLDLKPVPILPIHSCAWTVGALHLHKCVVCLGHEEGQWRSFPLGPETCPHISRAGGISKKCMRGFPYRWKCCPLGESTCTVQVRPATGRDFIYFFFLFSPDFCLFFCSFCIGKSVLYVFMSSSSRLQA